MEASDVEAARIREEIERHRSRIEELEEELLALERGANWLPSRFYTAYHALAGIIIGAVAAWVALAVNALGSQVLHGDPFLLMRYYATIFTGTLEEANRAAMLVVALGMHTITGAVCGAPIHVFLSRWHPRMGIVPRLAVGAALGLLMWVVNFYGVLSWLQPMLVGGFLINEIPAWVAALTHVTFTITVVLLQPLGAFDPQSYAAQEN